jgi:alcohol dehydrogenase class IV
MNIQVSELVQEAVKTLGEHDIHDLFEDIRQQEYATVRIVTDNNTEHLTMIQNRVNLLDELEMFFLQVRGSKPVRPKSK